MNILTGKTLSPFLLMLLVTWLAYRPVPQQRRSDELVRLSTELVVVEALVVNKKTGWVVSGLGKEDFTLYEDGVRQQIQHLSQDKRPLSFMLLVDTSGSVWPLFNQLRGGALQVLESLKPEDEVALTATASLTELVQGFTKDRQLMVERIKSLNKTALGDDGILLHEAIYQAAVHLRQASNPDGRRVVMVLTDNLSTQFSPSQGHSEEEAIHALSESGATVWGVMFDATKTLENVTEKHLLILAQKRGLAGDVRIYAEKTGGIIVTSDSGEIETRLTEMIDRLSTHYSIGYVPSNQKRDGKFRKIKLQLSPEVQKREGGVVIKTREGYYAPRGINGSDKR